MLLIFVLAWLATIFFFSCAKNEKPTTNQQIDLLKAQAEFEVVRGQAAKNRAALVQAQTESLKVVGNILEIKSRAELLKAQAESHKYSEERSTYIIAIAGAVFIILLVGVFVALNRTSKRNQKLQDNVNLLVSLAAPKYPQIPASALALLTGASQTGKNTNKPTQPQIAANSAGSEGVPSLSIDMWEDDEEFADIDNLPAR
ncbi:MAG TPA: hypothetical protein PLK76_01880 [bacterium]|nr:hypothetical protein [bacterium]